MATCGVNLGCTYWNEGRKYYSCSSRRGLIRWDCIQLDNSGKYKLLTNPNPDQVTLTFVIVLGPGGRLWGVVEDSWGPGLKTKGKARELKSKS